VKGNMVAIFVSADCDSALLQQCRWFCRLRQV
jgi:hypothetical protein